MKLIFASILALALALTGCASPGGLMARDGFVARAASAYDESLVNAEGWMCRGASIGSVVRSYGMSEQRWEAWRTLCGYSNQTELDRPESLDPVFATDERL